MHLSIPFRQAINGGERRLDFRTESGPRQVQVRIPPGVENGQRLRVPGKGSPGPAGGPPGDLYLVMEVEPDPVFSRENDDLIVTVRVPFSGICLGTSVEVPTLKGKKRVKVPAGMASGNKIRLRGFGVPGTHRKGDLYAVIEVAVPSQLDDQQKAVLQELKKAGL
jgi:curved DNA-binding protein